MYLSIANVIIQRHDHKFIITRKTIATPTIIMYGGSDGTR